MCFCNIPPVPTEQASSQSVSTWTKCENICTGNSTLASSGWRAWFACYAGSCSMWTITRWMWCSSRCSPCSWRGWWAVSVQHTPQCLTLNWCFRPFASRWLCLYVWPRSRCRQNAIWCHWACWLSCCVMPCFGGECGPSYSDGTTPRFTRWCLLSSFRYTFCSMFGGWPICRCLTPMHGSQPPSICIWTLSICSCGCWGWWPGINEFSFCALHCLFMVQLGATKCAPHCKKSGMEWGERERERHYIHRDTEPETGWLDKTRCEIIIDHDSNLKTARFISIITLSQSYHQILSV